MDGGADDQYRGRLYLGPDAERWKTPQMMVHIIPTYHPAVSSYLRFPATDRQFDFDAASARSISVVKYLTMISSVVPPGPAVIGSSS
jgi:hypothetical protein